jgi:hypothetical protein
MKYLYKFKHFEDQGKSILLIVDVQKSFKKYFTDNYLKSLNSLAEKFDKVYQIFDNHHEGKDVDRDYLYDKDPDLDNKSDLYNFPNQIEMIEKRYNYDVDADFYKNILNSEIYNEIKSKEKNLKRGEYFLTTEGTIIVYIGNKHKWFHVPKKLYDVLKELKEAQSGDTNITIVGGADGECLDDIVTTCESLGLRIMKNSKYIYSANHCPIK